MASIEPRINANGVITSYRIIVSDGADYQGNPIKYRMLWTPPRRNMTEKQIQKELHAAAVRFEDDIRQGYKLNSNQTFFEYAQYVMELKERTGIKTLTLDRYLEMLPRIYEAIGHLKLSQIRPQHLNEFYMNLSKPGARADRSGQPRSRSSISALNPLVSPSNSWPENPVLVRKPLALSPKAIPCAWRKQRHLPTQWTWISRSFSM